MKSLSVLLFLAAALALPAAETNAPATNAYTLAQIPDASHAPVRVTNTVTIAGEHIRYAAETGMLPLLKADGTSRASISVSYTHLTLPTNREV